MRFNSLPVRQFLFNVLEEYRKIFNLPPGKISSGQCYFSLRLGYILGSLSCYLHAGILRQYFCQIILNALKNFTLQCYQKALSYHLIWMCWNPSSISQYFLNPSPVNDRVTVMFSWLCISLRPCFQEGHNSMHYNTTNYSWRPSVSIAIIYEWLSFCLTC